ncbi:MAG: hypothetical protein ACOYIT_03775 [Christensenellales bacterium]|jgi:predicted lipid-binding transport protein (Tim44 family)
MSENRNRYSSAPLQDLKQAKKKARQTPRPPRNGVPQSRREMKRFTGLQLMLMVILPLFFVIALFVQNTLFFLAFALISVICLMITWLVSAFAPNARATLTIIHIALVVVALFAVLLSPPPVPKENADQAQPQTAKESMLSASMLTMMQDQQVKEGPTATPNPGLASFAQQRLEEFLSAWSRIDYTEMAKCCLPSWIAQQESPETAMFHLRANRTIVSYEILEVTGNDMDQTRTINMNALIDKSNGNPPQTNRFQVLMIRNNDNWYVDPRSLTSLGVIESEEEIAARTMTTIVPTATPNPDTLLYYNEDGGRYYHTNNRCPNISEKYLPLTASFHFRDLSTNPELAKLSPCGVCGAP